MTCREVLKLTWPDYSGWYYNDDGFCAGCPSFYGIMGDPDDCLEILKQDDLCTKCWDREVYEYLEDEDE